MDHQGEEHPKAILVDAGGTLEIHGEPRLSWTKITETLTPISQDSEDIYFNHAVRTVVSQNYRLQNTCSELNEFCSMNNNKMHV